MGSTVGMGMIIRRWRKIDKRLVVRGEIIIKIVSWETGGHHEETK
jgi:hypothetical protein